MATVNAQGYGVLHINDGLQGWTETYELSTTTLADMKAAMAAIWAARVVLLPPTSYLAYGTVGLRGKPRGSRPFQTTFPDPGTANQAPMSPTASATVNDCEIAVHARFFTDDGDGVSYHYRSLPDDQVVNKKGIAAVVIPVFPLVNAGTTWIDRLGDFLSVVKAKTLFSSRKPDTAGTPPVLNFDQKPWGDVAFRGLRKKNTGRPFGLQPGRAAPR